MGHKKMFVSLLAISLCLVLLLVGCVLFFNLSSLDKKISDLSKKEYKVDDVVEILVGENITETFYVIDDSGSKLTLITQNVLFSCPFDKNGGTDFESSSLKKALSEYTIAWVFAEKIRLLSMDEFKKGLLIEFKDDDKYSSSNYSKYLSIQDNVMNDAFSSYWLSDNGNDGYAYQAFVSKEDNIIQANSVLSTEEGGVRAVIDISKEFVK